MKKVIITGLIGAVTTLLPTLNAQTCFGNGDIVGAYAFVGSSSINIPNTGTTTTTSTVSNTPIGQLLGDITATAVFGTVGRVVADGAGNLYATPNSSTPAATQVGTYSANTDCTISVTLNDAFKGMAGTSTGSTGTGTTTTSSGTPLSVSFEGVVLNHGNEIDLVQATPTTSTTSTTVTSGANLTLRKMLQSTGCSDATLNGAFGLFSQAALSSSVASGGTGTGTTGGTTGTQSSFPLVGRFFANGDGTLGSTGASTALAGRQLSGIYTVNGDCTGTVQLVTNSGVVRNLSFAIVQSSAGDCRNPGSGVPELLFANTDQGIRGFGSARRE